MELDKQVALISGANRGFGKELAKELLSRGVKVYAGARKPEKIDLPGVVPIQLDITDPASIENAIKETGDITLLINNAGSSTGASLLTGSIKEINLEFNTHFFGTLSMIRSFAPIIERNGGGTILNILSVLSWVSVNSAEAYSAAKAAEWAMTNSLRLDLAPRNIRVSGLHVSYMDTDMTAGIEGPKENPKQIAKIAIDGIEADAYEIVADELSKKVQQGLSGGVNALYSQLTK
jgi:NAD(P)-dependent dehydrogenase (short-subunit alcohol dehydrogenase family)